MPEKSSECDGKILRKVPKIGSFGYGAAFGSKAQLKPLAGFVFGTGRSSEAFIEEKLLRDEATELRLIANFGSQHVQPYRVSSSLAARECDVGTIRTIFRSEPARDVAALTFFWSASNSGVSGNSRKENSRAIKEA